MQKEEETVREVFDMWAEGPEGAKAAWRKHGAETLIWWNSARGQVEGLQACLDAIDAMYEALGVNHTKVPIKNLVVEAGRVFVERSDNLYSADGRLIQAVPVVGVVEFDGEKIAAWRDYADDWMLKLGDGSTARSDA